eukprot:2222087-Pyramimonas_sp.AAC.1
MALVPAVLRNKQGQERRRTRRGQDRSKNGLGLGFSENQRAWRTYRAPQLECCGAASRGRLGSRACSESVPNALDR